MSKPKTSKALRPFDEERPLNGDKRDNSRDIVAELAGVLKGSEISDSREEYTDYLRQKYS